MSREIVASKPCIELKSYQKIYSSVDSLYAWLYHETKQKNCLFDEALCHIGYNKLNEEFWTGEGREWFRWIYDRIPSTTPGAEPPRDAKDSGSARSHSTHLETSSSNRP